MSRPGPEAATRVCLLTPSGRGAVAVVAVAGRDAVAAVDQHFRAASGHRLAAQSLGRIAYGRWGVAAGEDLLVCRRAPEEIEIHCHGGSQSAMQILEDLRRIGCAEVPWEAWHSQKSLCAFATEARTALTSAPTLRTATILLDQYHGAFRNALTEILTQLQAECITEATNHLEQLLERAALGLHLTRPWVVAIGGLPNVGKSSLMNALVGYRRAIVFDQPGTTRDVVAVTTAVDGWPIELCDTAGLHKGREWFETAGIALARGQLKTADQVLWVLDATEVAQSAPRTVWQLARAQAESVAAQLARARTLIVVNKMDLVEGFSLLESQAIATSTLSGLGIEGLLDLIARRLVPQAPPSRAGLPISGEQVETLRSALRACREANRAKAVEVVQGSLESARPPSLQR